MSKVESSTRIVTARYFLPDSCQENLIHDGGIVIQGDTILECGTREKLLSKFPDSDTFHENHGLLMPGLINTHTHAPMSCLRGFADDLPLMTWLQEHIFPVESKLTPDMVYASSLLSMAEMIKTGTTSFCDMYLFAKEVARATETIGLRGWIGEVLYNFPSPNYGELENGFTYIEEMFEQYNNHPTITITADPHAVYTCSPELLKRIKKTADKHNCLLVTHLSENETEVQGCIEQYGCSPVQHLYKLGLLGPNLLAAHCVQLSDDDMQLLSDNDVKISHCAESNMKLASGVAKIPEMLSRQMCVSIGTDGSASNNDVDMFGEMNSVAKIHKVQTLDPTVVNSEQTLAAATIQGAKALGAETFIGSLEAGKKADCIILDMHQPHLTPVYNIVSHLVYAARGTDTIHSFINGRMVMQNRKLLTIDEPLLLRDMQRIGKEIFTSAHS